MGLSQADAARRLNVSTLGSIPIRRFCVRRPVQADHELQHLQKTVFWLFRHEGEEPLLCRSSLQTTFKASGRRISATKGAKSSSQCRSVCKKTSCVRSLNGRQLKDRLCWAREHVSWTQQQWASVLFTDEVRFTMESDSGRLLIWKEQRTRYHQIQHC
ncbi:HTH_Tnp_Tc3_2 domain-containing protein [Trichonephila clavipes]|nr:HTH_Tnp_Tc3_2 domain-containing protein [Trichonephila clavipes]